MKLLRLQLNVDFRSLAAGFEVHFLREWDYESCFKFAPSCLVGLNGSGKSNLLEALAAIFYHVEVMHLTYRPEGFIKDKEHPDGFDSKNGNPDAYELEYFYHDEELKPSGEVLTFDARPVAHIRLSKSVGARPVFHWLNRENFEKDKPLELTTLESRRFLPSYVIGYSSGRNEVLSIPFHKMRFIHFDEYRHYLRLSLQYKKPEGRLIFLDDSYTQIILLCHFLFPSAAVQQTFKKRVKLDGVRRFRFIIRRAERVKVPSSDPATELELTSLLSGSHDKDEILQARLIDKLIKCATCHHEDYRYVDEGSYDLYLDYWMDKEMEKAFRYHFGEGGEEGSQDLANARSALNLFHALQLLLTLNGYQASDEIKTELYESGSLYSSETLPTPASHDRIFRIKDFEIIKEGVTATLYGKALSDGEHQFLHTIGLCLLFRHEPALFLLDEPETHLNPDWRAAYISELRNTIEADKKAKETMREIILTSHSPFIISDCHRENVFVFKKDTSNNVTCDGPGFQTFGASANAITIKVFGQTETIGDYAMETVKDLRERLDAGIVDPDTLIDEAGRKLGDSVEKVLFINQALNKKEGR